MSLPGIWHAGIGHQQELSASSSSSQSGKKVKKHRLPAKPTYYADDSDIDSGLSTSVSEIFDVSAASDGEPHSSPNCGIQNPPPIDDVEQMPTFQPFVVNADDNLSNDTSQDGLLETETECHQEVGGSQHLKGVLKTPQPTTDSSLNQAATSLGIRAGVFEGPEKLKLEIEELRRKLSEEVQEKNRLQMELDDAREKLDTMCNTELSKQVLDLQSKLKIKEEEVDSLKERVANLEKEKLVGDKKRRSELQWFPASQCS